MNGLSRVMGDPWHRILPTVSVSLAVPFAGMPLRRLTRRQSKASGDDTCRRIPSDVGYFSLAGEAMGWD